MLQNKSVKVLVERVYIDLANPPTWPSKGIPVILVDKLSKDVYKRYFESQLNADNFIKFAESSKEPIIIRLGSANSWIKIASETDHHQVFTPGIPKSPPTAGIDNVKYTEVILTYEEKEVLDYLTIAHNEFVKLPRQHPSEITEWVYHLHALQRILGFRLTQRVMPNIFPVPET